jgi:hypothetical protein
MLGRMPVQVDLLRSAASFVEGRVDPDSIYGVLHRECFSLFPDEMFADLFTDMGRRSVPPMIVAVVMVLQRLKGLSDREAVDRFAFDARWKYAAEGLGFRLSRVCAHGAGGHAGEAGPLGSAGPHLRNRAGGGKGGGFGGPQTGAGFDSDL